MLAAEDVRDNGEAYMRVAVGRKLFALGTVIYTLLLAVDTNQTFHAR